MKKYFEAENDTIPTKHFPMVLYFTATWCGPCKKISPIFETLSEENKKIAFVKIDIDNNTELASGIKSVPTFIFIKEKGKVHKTLNGAKEESLRKYVSEL